MHRRAMKSLDRLPAVHSPNLVLRRAHPRPSRFTAARDADGSSPTARACSRDVRDSQLRSTATVVLRTLHSRICGFTVVRVKILQIAPALHGAKMQTTEGTYPVVVWALIEADDGNRHVVGLSVGGKGDKALVSPDQGTFESYSQTG